MFLLGIDIGTSSIKASLVDATTSKIVASATYPEKETEIIALQPGWAEQHPQDWWKNTINAIKQLLQKSQVKTDGIKAIGIGYQMHGLVLIDKNNQVLRPSIIWCDSRAVPYGEAAFNHLGKTYCDQNLLNSPGNFTAAKLAWVKKNEPDIYAQIDKIMLPGDYIALQLTGQVTCTSSSLSEGIFWDFKEDGISASLMDYFGFSKNFIPDIRPVFSIHGTVTKEVAQILGIPADTPVSYKAGDQPNNALSLNVLEPGEVAATAGTSGVIYAVTDELAGDKKSRVNSFAHVNHSQKSNRVGVLLCINGTGIMNRWAKDIAGKELSYAQMNTLAATAPLGSEGLQVLPFGNGAERMLENKYSGATISGLQLTIHQPAHIFRAVQEGIACSFRYGLDIMRENNIAPGVIRAGKANMFLSELFTRLFVQFTNTPVELYENDGAAGAAIGAGIGAGVYTSPTEAFANYKPVSTTEPDNNTNEFEEIYSKWKATLQQTV